MSIKTSRYNGHFSRYSTGKTFNERRVIERDANSFRNFANKITRHSPNQTQQILAAETLIECAVHYEEDESQACEDIAKSQDLLTEVVSQDIRLSKQLGESALKASLLLAYIPEFQYKALEKGLVDHKIQNDTYESLVVIADQASGQIKNSEVSAGFFGVASELLCLLSLQRFACKSNDQNGYQLSPSTFEEDQAGVDDKNISRGWDISVFSNFNELDELDLSYKVQVKTSRDSVGQHLYTPDISVVYSSDIRNIGNIGKTIGWRKAFKSYVKELTGGKQLYTDVLDTMEDNTLDALKDTQ